MQRALIQYRNPANYDLVKEALLKEGRKDLIGFGRECLIPPRKPAGEKPHTEKKKADGRQDRGRNSGPASNAKRNEKKPSAGKNRNWERGKR
jgi:hypothetical protein